MAKAEGRMASGAIGSRVKSRGLEGLSSRDLDICGIEKPGTCPDHLL